MSKDNTTTLVIDGAKIKVNSRELFRAWLEKHVLGDKAAVITTTIKATRPPLNEGEEYAGILIGKDGAPDQHIILLPGDQEKIKWQAANEWATSIGGSLPTRPEQALLYANLKEHFKENWYWSETQHASNSGYAWCQTFGTAISSATTRIASLERGLSAD